MIINLEIGDNDQEQVTAIFSALVTSGGLSGVKGGQTILHFDANGNFMGVQLNYWPWRKRSEKAFGASVHRN